MKKIMYKEILYPSPPKKKRECKCSYFQKERCEIHDSNLSTPTPAQSSWEPRFVSLCLEFGRLYTTEYRWKADRMEKPDGQDWIMEKMKELILNTLESKRILWQAEARREVLEKLLIDEKDEELLFTRFITPEVENNIVKRGKMKVVGKQIIGELNEKLLALLQSDKQ